MSDEGIVPRGSVVVVFGCDAGNGLLQLQYAAKLESDAGCRSSAPGTPRIPSASETLQLLSLTNMEAVKSFWLTVILN
jgi:hypothetical protein